MLQLKSFSFKEKGVFYAAYMHVLQALTFYLTPCLPKQG